MGVSTDGELNFGIIFEEDTEFPWEKYDFDDWWMNECGWEPPFELYDSDGEYIDGVRPPEEKIGEYFRAMREFESKNPAPIRLINYCSSKFPMWMIAVGQGHRASRGYPQRINPDELIVYPEEIEMLKDFCEKYIGEFSDPGWYLTSYYG